MAKVILYNSSKTIERAAINKTAVGNKCYYTIIVNSVHCPAVETGVHIVNLSFLRCAMLNVGFLNALIDVWVLAVLVVLVLV
jgi:hypothetical protein